MELNIVSEWRMLPSFVDALSQLCAEYFPEVDSLNHIDVEYIDELNAADRVLLLGPVPSISTNGSSHKKDWTFWEPREGQRVYHAPSVKEVMGTPGGLTKLSYALGLYLSPIQFEDDFVAEYTRISADHETAYPSPREGDELVVDIEVSGDIDKDEMADCDLISVSILWVDKSGDPQIIVFDKSALEDWEYVADLTLILHQSKDKLTGHNGKFDFRWLTAKLGLQLYVADDTMLMHHAMFHGAGEHGLKPLARRILGAPEWEVDLKQYTKGKSHYERIPQDILCQYNAQDVFWTWMLRERFRTMLASRPNQQRAYELEIAASRMLQDVEAFGMPIDLEYADYLDNYYTHQYEEAIEELHRVAQRPINPNSPKQVKEYFADLGVRLGSTDVANLTKCVMNGVAVDFIVALIKCRKITKAHSTYVKGPVSKLRGDNRVHPIFNVHGTTTGRLSCRNPNVQNVPNDEDKDSGMPSLRRMYSAPAGWVFVGVDYSQAELRVIAELADDLVMLHDLRAGAPDFFDNMLSSIWPAVDFTELSKEQRKPYRLKLKRIVYGLNYGRSAWAIAGALTLDGTPTTEDEAQAIADNYLGRYAGLRAWRASTMQHVYDNDWNSPFGREFQMDVITGNIRQVQNAAWAWKPQGIASDICLTAAIDIHQWMKSVDFGGGSICATVHDAIYALVPEQYGDEVQAGITERMEASARRLFNRVVFPVDGHVAKNWNDC
jgi:DNA polymerase-1